MSVGDEPDGSLAPLNLSNKPFMYICTFRMFLSDCGVYVRVHKYCIVSFLLLQLAHFFTSAAGENGSSPMATHPNILSGDLRREMELQGTWGSVLVEIEK